MTERYFGFTALVSSPASRRACRSSTTTRRRSAPTASPTPSPPSTCSAARVVVDFGTATTFDAVSAKGEYLGGAIFPGIDISLDALFARAAALRRVELVEPRNVIGRTTVESIQSGASSATRRWSTAWSSASRRSWASARWWPRAAWPLDPPLVDDDRHHEPWLTLHGLRLIYEKNQ